MTQLKFDDTSSLNLLDNSTQWFQPKVKVVMVIVDGLRFDYLLNYENIDHDPALRVNKLKMFNKMYFRQKENFVILRAKADIPTLTVLRVPCLMTGNVPRLGSVLTAFGALPAEEDSIPRQLYLGSKKSYFTGDPILKEYFPKYLKSDYKLAAFNVKDLHVDEPSHKYTDKKILENHFDFLAAHLLRLDHMGHTSGLNSPQVLHAIEDVDRFLVHLMNVIDDNTMLLFAGDHGMNKMGKHGGASDQETHTAIVAYHRPGFLKYQHKNEEIKKVMRSINETESQVHQIDLAPTLAMLMGLPIPFSNMGQILNDLYPVGKYLNKKDQGCRDAAFKIQMLHDNYLNTLQVWNYFKKYHEGQSLFNETEYSGISDLFDEVQALYKEAQKMIDKSKQCKKSFNEAAAKAIKKSQKFSSAAHDLVTNKPPHDLVIFWQGFALLALVGVSYLLLVEYLYKTKDHEHITWTFKSWKSIAKNLIPVTIVLISIWTYMLTNDQIIMRPMTSSVLFLALYILGSSTISFLFPKKGSPEVSFEIIPSTEISEDHQRPSQPPKQFQSSLYSAAALAIIAYLFYLTHVFHLDKSDFSEFGSKTPYLFILLIGARFSGKCLNALPYIMMAAISLSIYLSYTKDPFLWSENGFRIMGLTLIADWLCGETQFKRSNLEFKRVWSYQYVICFTVLAFYHLEFPLNSEAISNKEFIQINLPRVTGAILIFSCFASLALRMPRQFIKRNFQVNFVLFLTLMQLHRKLIFFAIILSLMRIMTFIFKRTSFKNYLYPLFMGFISYVGLFSLSFTDRKLPRNFEPAFVGMREFHIGLCIFLESSAILSTIILGMLFMSFYSQDLESQDVELGNEKEEFDCQIIALKGNGSVIKKRNLLLYSLFYCLILVGAAINPVILKGRKQVYSMERFLVDAAFFIFTINTAYFMS